MRFEEECRRTKVIPRLLDEKSATKLVFATLIRCSQRWSRVSITDLERHELRLLRRKLGIDPPTSDAKQETVGLPHELMPPRLQKPQDLTLRAAGHDVVHVQDLGLAAASDRKVLACARTEDRVLVSADTDLARC